MNNAEVLIKFKGDTKDVDNSVNSLTKSMGSLTKSITLGNLAAKGISKAFQIMSNNLDGAISRYDTLQNFPKVMSNLGISTKESQKAIDKMSDKLSGLPTTLDQGAMAVQRFTSANGDIKKSTDLFLALNNAILAGGASTDIQATAMEQLAQAYAKGKPDMMEWRAMQTAMPAQLNQVAKAMGYTNAALLGEAVRAKDGQKEFARMMDTMMRMNKEGVNGFKSFEKQARNSTSGIKTAIVVAKTQVVKGITTMIDGLNKGLKKAKLGSISDIIANIGKSAKNVLDNIGKSLSKLPLKDILNLLSKIAPIIISVVAGFAAYNTAIKIAVTVTKLLGAAMSATPLGIVAVALASITAAVVLFGNKTSQLTKSIQKNNETLKDYKDTMADIEKQKTQTLSKSMNEISYYESLYDELKGITDENGRVQSGYEERAGFITSTLSDALGIEIKMTDGVIQGYQGIQGEIDSTIEKKKGLAYFNAHEEEYQENLKKEAELQKTLTSTTADREKAEKELMTKLKQSYDNWDGLTKKQQENMIKYFKGEIKYSQLSMQEKAMAAARDTGHLRAAKNHYQEAAKAANDATKQYAKNQSQIGKYRKAEEELAAGHYDAISKIFNDTIIFNGKTEAANNAKYEKGKKGWQEYKDYLTKNKDKFDQEWLTKEYQRIDEEMIALDTERNKANEKLKQKNTDILNTTIRGMNDQLSTIEGYNYEFRDAGNGLMQFYANGEAQGYPVTIKEAQKVTNGVLKKFNDGKMGAREVGIQISIGLAQGISSYGASAIEAARAVSEAVTKEMKKATKVHSPSRVTAEIGKFLVLGLNQGITQNTNKSIQAIDDYANKVTQAFAGGMATNISPQLAASSSLHYSPNVIVNNQMNMTTDPLGQVVGNIKTFANGSRNDYNYGMGA